MNVSTLAGVFAILSPNPTGHWSEEFNLQTPLSNGIINGLTNGINSSAIYTVAQVNGESVYVSGANITTQNFGVALNLKAAGPVTSTSSYPTTWYSEASGYSIRIQPVPGQSGKIRVGGPSFSSTIQPDTAFSNVYNSLWPNTGSASVGEGHSEVMNMGLASDAIFCELCRFICVA